jgi:hypothetical protein
LTAFTSAAPSAATTLRPGELSSDLHERKYFFEDLDVVARLAQVLLPLFLEVFVLGAGHCGFIKLHATALVLERLQQQFLQLG